MTDPIDPIAILKLITEVGQELTLETRVTSDRGSINTEYGFASEPTKTLFKLFGYVYSATAAERPVLGASFLEGDAVGVVSSLGATQALFTPGCVLIADRRRYIVAYSCEIKHRDTILYHRLHLTPEVKTH